VKVEGALCRDGVGRWDGEMKTLPAGAPERHARGDGPKRMTPRAGPSADTYGETLLGRGQARHLPNLGPGHLCGMVPEATKTTECVSVAFAIGFGESAEDQTVVRA